MYNPDTNEWRILENVSPDVILTNDRRGVFRADNYGWFFGWRNNEGLPDSSLAVYMMPEVVLVSQCQRYRVSEYDRPMVLHK